MDIYFRHDNDIDRTKALIRALDNTGVRMFMYFPQKKRVIVPAKTAEMYQCRAVYDNMPDTFAEDVVYEGDYPAFYEMYQKIDYGSKTASAVFRSKNMELCAKVTLTAISWTEDGKTDAAVGFIEDRSDIYNNEKIISRLREELTGHNGTDEIDDALKTMASAIASQYFAVYYIWLESRTYVCFQEKLRGILPIIGEKGDYEPAWDKYIEGFIEEKDQDGIREFVEITTLADRIGRKSSISHTYRRKEIGWTRGQFVAGQRDENGKPLTVIYTVQDINEEMETKRRKEEAELAALRDPLTKLWNRAAFEKFKEDEDYKNMPTGIMWFDIDRLKEINDRYGHDEGDKTIIAVASEVRDVFRQKDLVFRMGGDEFAVMLYNCSESIWDNTCSKIEAIHENVKRALPAELSVTISAGLCVSEDGYSDEMYSLADKAMYNTKLKGRGGCTLIRSDGEIAGEWHDNSRFLRRGDVLERNSTLTWRVEIPKRKGLPYKAYGDQLFMDYAGIGNNLSAEEVYRFWLDRVDPDYLEILYRAAKSAVKEGQAEAVYMWNHPQKGNVQLRCSLSIDSESEDYYSFIGYVHVLKGLHVFTMEDVNTKIKNALEEMYFCNYYIRLRDYSFKVCKAQPYVEEILGKSSDVRDVIDMYVKNIVAEDYRETMAAFMDLSTIKTRMKDTNYIGTKYYEPHIGWSRAKFVVVDRDENGEAETVAFVIEALQESF